MVMPLVEAGVTYAQPGVRQIAPSVVAREAGAAAQRRAAAVTAGRLTYVAGEEVGGVPAPLPVGVGLGAGAGIPQATYVGSPTYQAIMAGQELTGLFGPGEIGEPGYFGVDDVTDIPVGVGLGAGLPLIALGGGIALGSLRGLWTKFGPTVIKALVGGGVFAGIMKLIMGDDPDEKIIDLNRLKRRKRYTIGSNPRVRTLAKVSRHCQRLLKRHEKVIREFLPKKVTRYGIPPSRALSAIERAAIKG